MKVVNRSEFCNDTIKTKGDNNWVRTGQVYRIGNGYRLGVTNEKGEKTLLDITESHTIKVRDVFTQSQYIIVNATFVVE